MSDFGQRQRHGVTKNLVEGIGGLIVGVAAVLLLRQWLRPAPAVPARGLVPAKIPAPADAAAPEAPAGAGTGQPAPKPTRRTRPNTSPETQS